MVSSRQRDRTICHSRLLGILFSALLHRQQDLARGTGRCVALRTRLDAHDGSARLSEKQDVFVVLGGSGYVGQAVVRLLRSFGRRVMFSYGSNTMLAQKLAGETGAESFHFAAEDVAAAAGVATQLEGQAVGALINCLGIAGDPALYQGD